LVPPASLYWLTITYILIQRVTLAYAEYLSAKAYHEDAALAYASLARHEDSADAWEKALQWQACISAALAASRSPQEIAALARRMADRLAREGRVAEAAELLRQHADDDEEAVSVLVAGRAWDEAERLVALLNRRDLYETTVLPALIEAEESTLETAKSRKRGLAQSLDKFRAVLRRRKEVEGLEDDEGDHGGRDMDDSDLFSDTTSVAGISNAGSGAKRSNPASLVTR